MSDNSKNVIHIWDKKDIELSSKNEYDNPYTEVEVWVDLKGPDFDKRVYGFWDGGNSFKVRVTATTPGEWSWSSGSNQDDDGLNGKKGKFSAIGWSEEEKDENPCRRGFIKTSENGHAFEYADGTDFFIIGDTWLAAPTFRYRWYDDDKERGIGPDIGFKDMVKFRRKQGYNCVSMIAGHPTWAADGHPSFLMMDDDEHTTIRAAWPENMEELFTSPDKVDAAAAIDMHNEGGRPFLFPGNVEGYENVVPDFDRVNPEYFKHLDKKIDYLNSQGLIPFIEVSRRDVSQVWQKHTDWTISYSRYIQYIFSRYQANNCFLSPIHFDYCGNAVPSRDFNVPANLVIDKYGHPPFGTLVSANAAPTTLVNFGTSDEAKWLSFHQMGNYREHDNYWYLTDIYQSSPPMPAVMEEPYFPGFPHNNPRVESKLAEQYCRSGMYGSFLSGALGGCYYGAAGIWDGNVNKDAKYPVWESLKLNSGKLMPYLRNFAMLQGSRYKDLIPNSDMITPNKSGEPMGYTGWAYCAATKERDFVLAYFEAECPTETIRGLKPDTTYNLRTFNVETGKWWSDHRSDVIKTDAAGCITVPDLMPKGDWGLGLFL